MGAPAEKKEGGGESAFDFVYQVHETECRFYEFCEANGHPFLTPKLFFAQRHGEGKTGVLVLEDIGSRGLVPPMSSPLNRVQLGQVFQEVAASFIRFVYLYVLVEGSQVPRLLPDASGVLRSAAPGADEGGGTGLFRWLLYRRLPNSQGSTASAFR